MPRQAPASALILAGSGTACSAGSTISVAAVPNGRRHWPFQTQTRSPTRDGRHAFADALDLAGAVAVRNDAREGDLAGGPGAPFDVGWVDPGGDELDAHLAAARLRRLHVGDAQHLAGGTVLLVIGGAHGASAVMPAPAGIQ